jgi:putative flippase GtrA
MASSDERETRGRYRIEQQLLRFAAIGTLAFLVDTATLYFALGVLGIGKYSGRLLSFLVAATFTWAMNRRFTFPEARDAPMARQWLEFVAANGVGGVVNYGVYALLVTYVGLVAAHPVLGVAAGSLAGMTFNFGASRGWVFRRHRSHDDTP